MAGDQGILEWLRRLTLLLGATMIGAAAPSPQRRHGSVVFDEAGYNACMEQDTTSVEPRYGGVEYKQDFFELHRKLDEGDTGTVYLATDTRAKTMVVIKAIREELVVLYQAERCFLKHVRSPLMPQLYLTMEMKNATFRPGKSFAIVMEYLEGKDLQALAIENWDLARNRVPDLFIKVGGFIRDLHIHGLIYRDMKPENIMMLDDGAIKVIDFGFAGKTATPHPASFTNTYACPALLQHFEDMAQSDELIDYGPYLKTDEYGLGMVLLTIIFGYHPLCDEQGDGVDLINGVPNDLFEKCGPVWGTVLRGLLHVDPSERWSIKEALKKYKKLEKRYRKQRKKGRQ